MGSSPACTCFVVSFETRARGSFTPWRDSSTRASPMKVSSTGAATSARELRGPLTRPWAGGARPRPVARAGWWGAGCGGARGGRWGVRAVVEGTGRLFAGRRRRRRRHGAGRGGFNFLRTDGPRTDGRIIERLPGFSRHSGGPEVKNKRLLQAQPALKGPRGE